jgi:transposase
VLTLPPSVRVWLSAEPVDMRQGFDCLLAVVEQQWQHDPYAGHLFVFIGRARNRIKILFWDRGGFVIYYKRLQKGRFQMPEVRPGQRTVTLVGTQLSMLLGGFDLNVERLRRWHPPQSGIDTTANL